MLAREHLGDMTGAMEFAEMILSGRLSGLGGCKWQYSLALTACSGRHLIAHGKAEEAEVAIESAISAAQDGGYHYFTAMHVVALGAHVLEPAGRGGENVERLKAVLLDVARGVGDLQSLPY